MKSLFSVTSRIVVILFTFSIVNSVTQAQSIKDKDLSDIPFEKCNWTNKDYTNNILKYNKPLSLTEAGCAKCDSNNSQNPIRKKLPSELLEREILSPGCFFASAVNSVIKKTWD